MNNSSKSSPRKKSVQQRYLASAYRNVATADVCLDADELDRLAKANRRALKKALLKKASSEIVTADLSLSNQRGSVAHPAYRLPSMIAASA
jgi:ribosomal protein L19E